MGVRGVLRRILAIMQECNERIECYPKIAASWNFKGLALSYQGKYGEAIEAYNKAIELAPEWNVPRHNKSIAHQELSRPERAQIKTWCKPVREMLLEEQSPGCSAL